MPSFIVTPTPNPSVEPIPSPAPQPTAVVAQDNAPSALGSVNIADLLAYTPAPPPARGLFLPYIQFHWPVQGVGKPYHLKLVIDGKQNSQWMEWPFVVTTIFARGAAKIVNLASPEDTEWAFEQMPGMEGESAARYREMVSGSVPNVEKGTSYCLALWKVGDREPMIVTFDCFKTLNNATFVSFNDVKVKDRKALQFRNGDLQSVMTESSKTHRWFPDTGKFQSFVAKVDITEEDVSDVRKAMDKVADRVKGWLTR